MSRLATRYPDPINITSIITEIIKQKTHVYLLGLLLENIPDLFIHTDSTRGFLTVLYLHGVHGDRKSVVDTMYPVHGVHGDRKSVVDTM